MTEMQTRIAAGTGRRYGIEFGGDEPSHIHLPRRRRRVSTEGQSANPAWPADVGSEESRVQAQAFGADA
jgi:hypothetical protein